MSNKELFSNSLSIFFRRRLLLLLIDVYLIFSSLSFERWVVQPSRRTKRPFSSFPWPLQKCVTWILPMMLVKSWKMCPIQWNKELFHTMIEGTISFFFDREIHLGVIHFTLLVKKSRLFHLSRSN